MGRLTRILAVLITAVSVFAWTGAPTAQAVGKTLVVVDAYDIGDWDPSIVYSDEVRILLNVYETLVRYESETGKVLPLLATEWAVSDDALTWEFKLREGVKFHDGAPFNAAAAKASLDRTIELGLGGSFNWGTVEEIVATGEHTLTIKTSTPTSIDLIATAQYGSFIFSPKAGERGTEWFSQGNAAGTGPYKVRQWTKAQQIVLEKFDDYWGGWTGEEFDRVIVRIISENATQVQMLRAGEADIIFSPAPSDLLKKLAAEEGISVGAFDAWICVPMAINTRKYPTDNKMFRQALAHIMDYEAVSKDIYDGYASVPQAPVPQAIWGAGELDLPKFDLARASQLLEESGVPRDDWKVTYFAYSGNEEIRQVAELFQALASQVGVQVDIQVGEWGVLWDKQKSPSTAANLFALLFWPDYGTPSSWLALEYRTEDPVMLNFSYYFNSAFDAALDEGLRLEATDRETATKLYIEAQQMVVDDVAALYLADLQRTFVYRSDIQGVNYNPAYETVFVYDLRRQ